MRTDILRKTALTAAGLAFTGGAIAGPVTTALAAPTTPCRPRSPRTARAGERELGVRYEAQPNFYYCGPAAARNALSVQGKNIDVDGMAQRMGTTEAGTNSINDITPVLNKETGKRRLPVRRDPRRQGRRQADRQATRRHRHRHRRRPRHRRQHRRHRHRHRRHHPLLRRRALHQRRRLPRQRQHRHHRRLRRPQPGLLPDERRQPRRLDRHPRLHRLTHHTPTTRAGPTRGRPFRHARGLAHADPAPPSVRAGSADPGMVARRRRGGTSRRRPVPPDRPAPVRRAPGPAGRRRPTPGRAAGAAPARSASRSTPSSSPRTWRSVPAYRWGRRVGPAGASRPDARQAQTDSTGQTPQRGDAGGADHRAELHEGGAGQGRRRPVRRAAAPRWRPGRRRVVAGPASGSPATARQTTRRTLVSTTGCRCPYANAATARAVYVPDARQRQQLVQLGRGPGRRAARRSPARTRAAAPPGGDSRAAPTSGSPRRGRPRPGRPGSGQRASQASPGGERRGRPASAAASPR